MKTRLLTYLLLFISWMMGSAQNNVFVSQYFKVMPAFAPALNGANDFLDIKTGMRHQWLGYDGAPRTFIFSANGSLNIGDPNKNRYNSLRVNNMRPYQRRGVKIGVGGYLFDDRSGALRQLEALVSGAVHIPMNVKTYLSLGISGGVYSTRLDESNLFVLNPDNDLTYLNYLSNNNQNSQMKLTTGIALYSKRFYFSYSIMKIGGTSELESIANPSYSTAFTHVALGGLSIDAGPYFEVIPNLYIRHSGTLPTIIDAGFRLRYRQNPYIGFSYRNTNSIIAMFGFTCNDLLDIGYSYETFNAKETSGISATSHEIVLGLRLFNKGKYIPMW